MKQSINKQQLLLEFISVVFAVLLALGLNSWRESYALNNTLEKVVKSIRQEVERNDSLLIKSHNYRKHLLAKLQTNQNILVAVPIDELEINVSDNKIIAGFFKKALLFGERKYYRNVEVIEENEHRVLVLDDLVFDLKIESDTLRLMGVGNIQLKLPDLNNQSYLLAQATGTITQMDIGLVEQLSTVNSLIENYNKTGDLALQLIYKGEQQGLISVLEDLYSLEDKILKANTALKDLLKVD